MTLVSLKRMMFSFKLKIPMFRRIEKSVIPVQLKDKWKQYDLSKFGNSDVLTQDKAFHREYPN